MKAPMEATPFCERNVKAWLTLLVVLSVAVLGTSIWAGVGERRGRGRPGRTGPAIGGSQPVAPVAVPAVPPAAVLPSGGVGRAPSASTPRPDAVTGATASGGAQWVAGRDARSFNVAADVIRPSVVSIHAASWAGNERMGSGVVVDPAGRVVTSHHVVAGASAIVVGVPGRPGREYQARVVAEDPANDLALLRVDGAGPLPAARLADSSRTEVGDWVLAVGHPFGLGLTVTAGIVSGVRSSLAIRGGTRQRDLIQTDAPINEGSSGGPLVNVAGEVVGINTAIYAPTGVFSGTGFAVPSSRVARLLSGNVAAGPPPTPPRPRSSVWLGLGLLETAGDPASRFASGRPRGVLVSAVTPGSPAEEAELVRGDLVIAVAGQPVSDLGSFSSVISRLAPGQGVQVVYWRNGRTDVATVRTRGTR